MEIKTVSAIYRDAMALNFDLPGGHFITSYL